MSAFGTIVLNDDMRACFPVLQRQPEASVATVAASYFSKANCQFLSNVFVQSSTLAASTVFACQKDYLSEPRNHETRNGVPAMVTRMIG
jgi:hypothetical protein